MAVNSPQEWRRQCVHLVSSQTTRWYLQGLTSTARLIPTLRPHIPNTDAPGNKVTVSFPALMMSLDRQVQRMQNTFQESARTHRAVPWLGTDPYQESRFRSAATPLRQVGGVPGLALACRFPDLRGNRP